MKIYEKIKKIKNELIFILIQGVQGATREGPEPIPELKNTKNDIFSFFWIFLNRNRYEPEPVGTEPTRTEPGAPCTLVLSILVDSVGPYTELIDFL